MTLSELRSYCWDLLDDPSGGYFTQSILDMRLNLALRELQKRLISANHEYYVSCVKTNTAANQQVYSLPTDFLQVIRLEWYPVGLSGSVASQKILPITPNQRDIVGIVQNDVPQFYSLSKNNFVLWPIPTTVVEMHLEYAPLVIELTASGDVPDAPAQFQEYIAILATRDCLIKDGRPLAPIETKLQQYELLLKQISVQRQADNPRMVVQTGGEWTW